MLHFHRPWFQKNVLDMGYTLPTPLLPSTAILLLCLSPDEVQTSATAYTVMETAKANGLNPEKFIRHLLTVLSECFAQDPKAAVVDLLPWVETVQRLCRE